MQIKDTIVQYLPLTGHRDICLTDRLLNCLFLRDEKVMYFSILSSSPKNCSCMFNREQIMDYLIQGEIVIRILGMMKNNTTNKNNSH